MAACKGHIDCLKLLIERGADVEAPENVRDNIFIWESGEVDCPAGVDNCLTRMCLRQLATVYRNVLDISSWLDSVWVGRSHLSRAVASPDVCASLSHFKTLRSLCTWQRNFHVSGPHTTCHPFFHPACMDAAWPHSCTYSRTGEQTRLYLASARQRGGCECR